MSFVGDVGASITGVHMPLAVSAAKGSGNGSAKVDPAEDDYSVPKEKRTPAKGAPQITTVLMKVSALMMAAGSLVLLTGIDLQSLL